MYTYYMTMNGVMPSTAAMSNCLVLVNHMNPIDAEHKAVDPRNEKFSIAGWYVGAGGGFAKADSSGHADLIALHVNCINPGHTDVEARKSQVHQGTIDCDAETGDCAIILVGKAAIGGHPCRARKQHE